METKKNVNQSKSASVYNTTVLSTNKSLKEAQKSFGAARSILLNHAKEIELSKDFLLLLNKSKKCKTTYEFLNSNVRKTKTGKVPAFYVLQLLHKICNSKKLSLPVASAKSAKVPASGAVAN